MSNRNVIVYDPEPHTTCGAASTIIVQLVVWPLPLVPCRRCIEALPEVEAAIARYAALRPDRSTVSVFVTQRGAPEFRSFMEPGGLDHWDVMLPLAAAS